MMRGTLRALTFMVTTTLGMSLTGCSDDSHTAAQTVSAPEGPRTVLVYADVIDWQDVSAEITTVDKALLIARIPGILTTLTVREGDLVAKGQVIGRIVDSQLPYQASAYAAQAAAAEAQAAQAKSELSRVRFLHQNGVYAKARLDQAQAAADAAKAAIRAARAQQAAVGAVAGQGSVIAPVSGRILRADIPAGSPVAPGMTIAEITAGPAIVRIQLPETIADKVHAGSQVMTMTDKEGQRMGRVNRLYPSVSAGQVTADVDMPGIDNRLIGRRIAARIETGKRKALLVPASHVITRYGIDYLTTITGDGSTEDIPVQTSPSTEPGKVEILSGAKAGDVVTGRDAVRQNGARR